jgi:hypothetical protein
MLKHCAANRKRRLSGLPNVRPYIYNVKVSGFSRNFIDINDISFSLIQCHHMSLMDFVVSPPDCG